MKPSHPHRRRRWLCNYTIQNKTVLYVSPTSSQTIDNHLTLSSFLRTRSHSASSLKHTHKYKQNMEPISLSNHNTVVASPLSFSTAAGKKNGHSFPASSCCSPVNSASKLKPSISSPSFRVSCSFNSERYDGTDDEALTTSWAYGVLGLDPPCSSAQLKAAFRTKVKQCHPDVTRGAKSDAMIRHVIHAYEILSNCSKSEVIERECMDPFDQPECEAFDLFVNGVLCLGKGCPYSCVDTAPHVFKFSSATGTAHAVSQGHGEDSRVQRAVGLCPRSCIHYVTPSQRIILEELLDGYNCLQYILDMPYDTSAESEFLYSLIVKAKYENNRYRGPKRNAKVSGKHVDWF